MTEMNWPTEEDDWEELEEEQHPELPGDVDDDPE